jgi:hypothetical protein
VLGLAAIGVVAVGVALLTLTVEDRAQQQHLVESLAGGRLTDAFGGPPQTSGPGFGLFALPWFLLARPALGADDAYVVASLLALAPLLVAATAASRAVGVASRSWAELGRVAAITCSVPVLSCYSEAFHPADVLAVAASLGAFALWQRGRITPAFLLLGFAVVTRQWAVAVVAVLAVLSDREDRLTLVLGSLAVGLVAIVPFLVANREATVVALTAKQVGRFPLTLPGIVAGTPTLRTVLGRVLPLALLAAFCTWLALRARSVAPTAPLAVAALAAALLLRPLVDPAGFTYYLAPGVAFLVLVRPTSWRWPALTVLLGIGLVVRREASWHWPAYAGMEGPLGGGFGRSFPALQAVGTGVAILETLVVAAIVVACLREVGSLTGGGTPSALEGPSGRPGAAQAGDGVLG